MPADGVVPSAAAAVPSGLRNPGYCMFCGTKVVDLGEAYYDHLRASKGCESAWREWRDRLTADHPGGD